MTKRLAWVFALAVSVPALALAQDAPAPAPAPVAEPAPAPIAEPPPAPEPAPMAEPAPAEPVAYAEAPAEEPAVEEESGVTGWFRIDMDPGALQLWAGATHPLSDTVGLASDIYVVGTTGEFDIGPTFTAGSLIITPMVGLAIDFAAQHASSFIPQLYLIADGGSIYFEFWSQLFLSDMLQEGSLDYLHLRGFPLYKASEQVAIGVEVDANIGLKNKPLNTDGDEATLLWLPIGPHLKLFYGGSSTLELFVGYDVAAKDLGNDKLSGRFTFVQTW